MKKMLLVNGSYNDVPLVFAAQKLGYYVITSGNDARGDAHRYANEYCPCDYSDKEAIYNLAKQKQVDAICSCGNDFGATSASYACDKLGLPGHDTYDTSRIFHEKDQFKIMVKDLGLLSPQARVFTCISEADTYVKCAMYPLIIKPVDLGGGKGIGIARSKEEGVEAVKKAFEKSKIKHIVIEEFIDGTQHGFVCYIKDKRVVFDYSTDDYSYLNPYMVWIASGYPSDKYDSVRSTIIADINRIAAFKNISDGFLTVQYLMKDGKAYYLETMRRCLGNFHYKCISRDIGINLYELFVATEAGIDCSDYLNNLHFGGKRSGFMGIYGNKNGKIKSITFRGDFERFIFDRIMLNGLGYIITDYLHDKLGMVFFSFDNQKQREEFMEQRYSLYTVTYES